MEASAKGFKHVTYSEVRVVITETVKLDIRLTVGAVEEVVKVESSAAQLQTESSTQGRVTSGEVLNSLPWSRARLHPGHCSQSRCFR